MSTAVEDEVGLPALWRSRRRMEDLDHDVALLSLVLHLPSDGCGVYGSVNRSGKRALVGRLYDQPVRTVICLEFPEV